MERTFKRNAHFGGRFPILLIILLLISCTRVSGTFVSEKSSLVQQVEFLATYLIDDGHIFVVAGQELNLKQQRL